MEATIAVDPRKWVDKYYDYFMLMTTNRVKDKNAVGELVEDTLLSGLQSLSQFKGRIPERKWLTAILHRKIIKYYCERLLGEKQGLVPVMTSVQPGFQKDMDQQESRTNDNGNEAIPKVKLLNNIKKRLHILTQSEEMVFRMSMLKGLDVSQISTTTGLSKRNVQVLSRRARKKIANNIQHHWEKYPMALNGNENEIHN